MTGAIVIDWRGGGYGLRPYRLVMGGPPRTRKSRPRPGLQCGECGGFNLTRDLAATCTHCGAKP